MPRKKRQHKKTAELKAATITANIINSYVEQTMKEYAIHFNNDVNETNIYALTITVFDVLARLWKFSLALLPVPLEQLNKLTIQTINDNFPDGDDLSEWRTATIPEFVNRLSTIYCGY